MFAEVSNVLAQYGPIGVDVLRNAIAQVEATGKTSQSIRYEVSEDRLLLIGRAYFSLIEKGRKPTAKGPSREMIDFLTEYAKARGMDKPESAAWGIAKTINKEGDKTFRAGGRLVYSPELDKFVDELKSAIARAFAGAYTVEVKKYFSGSSS